jgi:hypothetical protein
MKKRCFLAILAHFWKIKIQVVSGTEITSRLTLGTKIPHAQHTIETTNAQHAIQNTPRLTLFWKCIPINFQRWAFHTFYN